MDFLIIIHNILADKYRLRAISKYDQSQKPIGSYILIKVPGPSHIEIEIHINNTIVTIRYGIPAETDTGFQGIELGNHKIDLASPSSLDEICRIVDEIYRSNDYQCRDIS